MQSIQVGNAPCSWGIVGVPAPAGEHAGYVRMLDELTETGYAGTELGDWGFMPTDPAALRAELVKGVSGLPVLFHHYTGGYIETPEEIARLLQMTDPAVLGLVFDTGHYAYGTGTVDGDAVLEAMDRFADRIQFMHFKDCDPRVAEAARQGQWEYNTAIEKGLFCELGQGYVDFPAVLERLRARHYAGWVLVEQDVLPGM